MKALWRAHQMQQDYLVKQQIMQHEAAEPDEPVAVSIAWRRMLLSFAASMLLAAAIASTIVVVVKYQTKKSPIENHITVPIEELK